MSKYPEELNSSENNLEFNRAEVSEGINEILNYAVENGVIDHLSNLYIDDKWYKWERDWEIVQKYYSSGSNLIAIKKEFKITLQSTEIVIINTLNRIIEAINSIDSDKGFLFKDYLSRGERYIFKMRNLRELNKHREVTHESEVINNFLNQLVNPNYIFEVLGVTRSRYNKIRVLNVYDQLPQIYSMKEWLRLALTQDIKSPKHKEVMHFITENNSRNHYSYLADAGLVKNLTDLGVSFSLGYTNFEKISKYLEENNIPVGKVGLKGIDGKTGNYRFIPTAFELVASEKLRIYKRTFKGKGDLEQ
jgi:heat shock protein HspQ